MAVHRSPDVAVVDDDAEVLNSFRFMLETAGFEVATYPSAHAFLERVGDGARCLILDHHMPLMTGIGLTIRLRAEGNAVPILLVTSSPSRSLVALATASGVMRVLDKPPDVDAVIGFVSSNGQRSARG